MSSEGPHPLLLDVRAAEEFAAGHLPEAVHLDLWGFSLPDTDEAPLRSFLWMIEHVLALRGVTNDRPVVVYGDTSDARAARVFWFLDYFGHPACAVLDGGVQGVARGRLRRHDRRGHHADRLDVDRDAAAGDARDLA